MPCLLPRLRLLTSVVARLIPCKSFEYNELPVTFAVGRG